MGESDVEPKASAPAWQTVQPPAAINKTEEPKPEPTATLEQARKFLKDPEVQKRSDEQKTEFLKTKGVSEADIEAILREAAQEAQPEPPQPAVGPLRIPRSGAQTNISFSVPGQRYKLRSRIPIRTQQAEDGSPKTTASRTKRR